MSFYDTGSELEHYNKLEAELLSLVKNVSDMSKKTLKSSINGDHLSAIEVIDLDDEVNIKKYEINFAAIDFLKGFAPKEKILRKVFSMNLIADKFDRISNNYKKINKQLIVENDFTQGTKLDLIRMLKATNTLIDLVYDSLKNDTLCDRKEIIKQEEKIQKIFKLEIDKGDVRSYNYNHYLLFKHIEKIGDNVRGIYEQLYFIEKGKYIEI